MELLEECVTSGAAEGEKGSRIKHSKLLRCGEDVVFLFPAVSVVLISKLEYYDTGFSFS